ncbi:TOPRIM nucleotidyl transferase/hydrolase domain-containing protein [Spongiactinospora sp. TRM90649]|uniref:TOPRIM nucleotidyl transferase/hydrolase domain-containing protein n=1 Tax=Spongiactinospora sp. TRM90649 TaxID=3031114 RepID=UPI0023F690BD|nr:TOPRIM nucleotidyl transferase/hydrolase domain-containing protein [Spongiactinospora sp. TRM90649]MDF5757212.1 ATP-dependent endonuclease [Spongiactinospora sp. TRM90649]
MSDTRTVVLVEGASDKAAVEALARRRGRDLDAEAVSVVAMGGATNIGAYIGRFGPLGRGFRLAGLCDAREEGVFQRALGRAGFGPLAGRDDLEAHGFFVCVADLEDELIRALGTDTVERVVEAGGELGAFRTLQKQPAWRGGATHDQLRRFMGSGSGRKLRYAAPFVEALDPDRVPRPLDALLAHLLGSRR